MTVLHSVDFFLRGLRRLRLSHGCLRLRSRNIIMIFMKL